MNIHTFTVSTRVLVAVAFLVLASAAVLIATHFIYTPLQVDGAWYGYPGYALAQGRDPGENYAPLQSLISAGSGTRVSFLFDTRNLLVYPIAAWFKAFGASIWSVKIFSLLQLFVLLGAVTLVLWRRVDTFPAAFGLLLVTSDVAALTLSSTDFRPDLAVAIFAVAVFATTVAQRGAFSWWHCLASVLLAFILVFVHLTAAVPFAVIGGAMLVDFALNRASFSKARVVSYVGVLATGAIGFLFHRDFRALLIPTGSDASTLYYANFGVFDLARIATKETSRWYGYFSDTNAPLLVAFVLIVALMVTTFRSQLSSGLRLTAPVSFGVLCGVVVLAILNPHRAGAHAFSVVVFMSMLSAYVLNAARTDAKQRAVSLLLCLVLVGGSVAKVLLSAKLVREQTTAELSNTALWNGVNSEFTRSGAEIVIGPSKLWAYLDPQSEALVVDRRTGDLQVLAEVIDRVDLLVLDEEYRSFEFIDSFKRTFPDFELELTSVIGDPSSRDRLEFFAPVRRRER